MNKSTIKGALVGGLAVTAVAASGVTGYQALNQPKFAEVLAAKEVTETVRTPREECEEVAVRKRAPVKDEHRIVGTAIGVVAGGLLGSTIGAGTGRTIATVAGAAAGGYAGNKVQQGMQNGDTVTQPQKRCKTVFDASTKSLGYDVSYRLDGKEGLVRMSFNPGERIPLRDGRLVLDRPAGS